MGVDILEQREERVLKAKNALDSQIKQIEHLQTTLEKLAAGLIQSLPFGMSYEKYYDHLDGNIFQGKYDLKRCQDEYNHACSLLKELEKEY